MTEEDLKSNVRTAFLFNCPGCNDSHVIYTPDWIFNNDHEKPTFSPSLLVRSGHYVPTHKGTCWCDFNKEHIDDPAPFICYQCHSFIKDGNIEFLEDCTHSLAGKTVKLPQMSVYFV